MADSVQSVLFRPELLEKIYEFLDLKSLITTRKVCVHWRLVSKRILKRHVDIAKEGHLWTVSGFRQSTYSVNNAGRLPLNEICLKMDPSIVRVKKNKTETEFVSDFPGLLLAMVLELDWIVAIGSLKLTNCLTVEDWMVVGMAVLKKARSLKVLEIDFCCDSEAEIPLCYTELVNQVEVVEEDGEFLCENVKQVQFNFSTDSCSDENFSLRYGEVVKGIFASCTKLKTFRMHCTEAVEAWVSRGENPVEANDGSVTWAAGIRNIPSSSTTFSPLSLFEFFNAAPLKGDREALSALMQNASLSPGKPVTKLIRLYWEYSSLNLSWTNPPEGNLMFMNLQTVQLERNKDIAVGLELDHWIRMHLHKLAPNVERLVANVQHRRHHVGDCLVVLDIARTFKRLQHLVLTNDEVTPRRAVEEESQILKCLGTGLKSVTVSVKHPELLQAYARCFVRASEKVQSITRLEFYRQGVPENYVLELNLPGIQIPYRVTVTTGAWTSDRAKEAGIESF